LSAAAGETLRDRAGEEERDRDRDRDVRVAGEADRERLPSSSSAFTLVGLASTEGAGVTEGLRDSLVRLWLRLRLPLRLRLGVRERLRRQLLPLLALRAIGSLSAPELAELAELPPVPPPAEDAGLSLRALFTLLLSVPRRSVIRSFLLAPGKSSFLR